MGHIHAELMMQYAEDARETDAPWERWECRNVHGEWRSIDNYLSWSPRLEYRRKPRTITINGREVPEPMREAPEEDKTFFVAALTSPDFISQQNWHETLADKRWLRMGLCHSTKEAAIAHAEALLSFTEAK